MDIKDVLKQLKLGTKYAKRELTNQDVDLIASLYPFAYDELIDLFEKNNRIKSKDINKGDGDVQKI